MRLGRTLSTGRIAGLSVILCILFVLGWVVMAESGPEPVTVTVIADGQEWQYSSAEPTVRDLLREAGVQVGAKDRVYPGLGIKPVAGMRIRVTRVEEKIVVQREPVKYQTVIRFDRTGRGKTVLQAGQPGEKEIKYLVTYKDGQKVACRMLSARVTKAPVKEIVAVSSYTQMASRGGTPRATLRMSATAYAAFHCGGSRSGRAALGMPARKGVVAVDPRVIRLGTPLYIEGYGYAIAGDTGGAIKGNRIDLCFDTYSEAVSFGRRYVTVHILE